MLQAGVLDSIMHHSGLLGGALATNKAQFGVQTQTTAYLPSNTTSPAPLELALNLQDGWQVFMVP